MNSLPPLHVTKLLQRYGLRPDKRLGQNFLIDPASLEKVVEAGAVGPEDAVLEIGPGLGSLTRLLAQRARQVVAVELDHDLLAPLQEVLAGFDNVRIVEGDILSFDPAALMGGVEQERYLVVANIPYYITSAILRHLLQARLKPDRMTLTVQQEVAERILAGPGDMSLLALSVQVYGRPRIAARIPAGAFYPPPNVDSAVIRLDLYPQPLIPETDLDTFFHLARAGFSQKRKTLRNSLAGGMHWPAQTAGEILQAAGIDPRRRAETLSLEEWDRLVQVTLQMGKEKPA